MKVCILFLVLISAQLILGNGQGFGQGPPSLPSYNCADWEKWLKIPWRNISLPHAYDCTRFYECDDRKIIEKACADRYRTRYNYITRRCEWNWCTKCVTFYDFSMAIFAIEGKQEWMTNL
jgi:Chitin binding Peritrophin-A domain